MKIALAQINPTVGDIAANSDLVKQYIDKGRDHHADLVVFSELALVGYPPKDLLLKPQLIDDNITALNNIAAQCHDIAALVGFVCRGKAGNTLHNSAALLEGGKVKATYYKQLLPTYDVFDEQRYFTPANSQQIVEFQGKRLGLTICEDIWQDGMDNSPRAYEINPFAELAQAGVDMVLNISASPFVMGKHSFRCDLFARQCRQHNLPLFYVNQIGGNDELIFDGCSCAFDNAGTLIAQARDFVQDLLLIDCDDMTASRKDPVKTDIASVHDGLVLGLRDYVTKCKFKSVILGLSGGIDSAITAALAAAALGPDKVTGATMPSRYSSKGSIADSEQLAKNLNIKILQIPIEDTHRAMEKTIQPCIDGPIGGVTEENIQARLRGNILMALSNQFGHLLLTTGNKSELAVGYCTMYGDMAGGLAVISDVPKTMVYQLAQYINRDREIIPSATINKPPSAELRPDQKDQDSLPPYDQLDDILHRYVEKEHSINDIIAAGFDKDTITRVVNLVDKNEYKRKQAAPGLKVTSRAFGFGRRMPIAQNYQYNKVKKN